MKIRKGFVSNSSSSSFVCSICGEIESGMDACLSDFDMIQCVNGHEFHTSCSKIEIDEDSIDKKQYLIDGIKNSKWISDKESSIKEVEEYDEDELENAFHDEIMDSGYPEEFCPICSMQEIDGDDMTKYLLKRAGLTKETVLEEVKSKFSSYAEFSKSLL